MTRCRICNRTLKNPAAIAKGIGPVCERRNGAPIHTSRKNDHDGDILVPYDGGDFWIERLYADTIHDFPGVRGTFVVPEQHGASGCRSNVPRMIYYKSPTGYNFGYGGSGPADFALNICLQLVHADDAYLHFQRFKEQFVAGEQSNRLEIPRHAAEKFFTDMGVQLLKKA